MKELYTIPSIEELSDFVKETPDYMHPCSFPYAVIFEGAVSNEVCDEIIDVSMKEEVYDFTGCSAETRELPRPLPSIFKSVCEYTEGINRVWWEFDLDPNPAAWLQTYKEGGSYAIHNDGRPGQSRKLTTVILLTDPTEYDGGVLRIIPYPLTFEIPRTRGTMITFPSWMLHEVFEVTRGVRQTINLGYWGPPFR